MSTVSVSGVAGCMRCRQKTDHATSAIGTRITSSTICACALESTTWPRTTPITSTETSLGLSSTRATVGLDDDITPPISLGISKRKRSYAFLHRSRRVLVVHLDNNDNFTQKICAIHLAIHRRITTL